MIKKLRNPLLHLLALPVLLLAMFLFVKVGYLIHPAVGMISIFYAAGLGYAGYRRLSGWIISTAPPVEIPDQRCIFTGALYMHMNGEIDGNIFPDGQSVNANAVLQVKADPTDWAVFAESVNGTTFITRVRQLPKGIKVRGSDLENYLVR